MKNIKIKASTIARLGALAVALVNQGLAIFGKNALPFTENFTYQIVSLVATFVLVVINAWYNNDITTMAILSGRVLTALKDGKLTEEEINEVLDKMEENGEANANISNNFFVETINKWIASIKAKKNNKK